MRCVPGVRRGFFPLDEELQLLAGHLTPSLQEGLVRLGTWMPFLRAATELGFFMHVTVSEPSARRTTEAAGAAYVVVQTEAVEQIERSLPPPPAGPALQFLSVDGAMVPLVHREWAEVKTLALGVVAEPALEKGEWVVHSTELSYFSRLAEAETFDRLALVETHRRGTETARQVCAVTDGAEWEQGFIDFHRSDAVRILDFSHAAGYVAQAGQAVLGEGSPPFKAWLKDTLHELKHGQPGQVFTLLHDMQAEVTARGPGSEATLETIQKSLTYLEKRRDHMDYARFQALGYPIGSGSVESANKLVVEARLKGAGMHWARCHVDPMVALRNIACSDRWEEAWPHISQCLRQQTKAAQRQHHQKRQAQRGPAPSSTTPLSLPIVIDLPVAEATPPLRQLPKGAPTTQPPSSPSQPKQPYRPAAHHPWRRSPIGRARYAPPHPVTDAKL
jgi:hypothetical protein